MLPRNMLAYLLTHNHFVSGVYMEYIENMKCQLHHIQLDKYFIETKHDQIFRQLC